MGYWQDKLVNWFVDQAKNHNLIDVKFGFGPEMTEEEKTAPNGHELYVERVSEATYKSLTSPTPNAHTYTYLTAEGTYKCTSSLPANTEALTEEEFDY